jgi:hypothetical protein
MHSATTNIIVNTVIFVFLCSAHPKSFKYIGKLLDDISSSESVNWELKNSLTDILESGIIYTIHKKRLIIFVYCKKYLAQASIF